MEHKGLRITKMEKSTLYKVQPLDRGAIPVELRGMYTSIKAAQDAIDRVDSHRGRKTKNAKTVSATGD